MPPRHAPASAKNASANNKNKNVFFSASSPQQPQQQQRAAAPRVSGVSMIRKKRLPCPNNHTVAHAAAALPLFRDLRAALSRVAAAEAALAAALAIPPDVFLDVADAVDAAVDRKTRVVRADAFDALDALDSCICARCCRSYALLWTARRVRGVTGCNLLWRGDVRPHHNKWFRLP